MHALTAAVPTGDPCLLFANISGMDISGIIEAKMKRNAEKYPVEKAKGRSDKYTEL